MAESTKKETTVASGPKHKIKRPERPENVKDEPGAEERFSRAVKRALETPPKSHEDLKASRRAKKGKDAHRDGVK